MVFKFLKSSSDTWKSRRLEGKNLWKGFRMINNVVVEGLCFKEKKRSKKPIFSFKLYKLWGSVQKGQSFSLSGSRCYLKEVLLETFIWQSDFIDLLLKKFCLSLKAQNWWPEIFEKEKVFEEGRNKKAGQVLEKEL